MFKNVLIGLVIILAAWMFIDTILKVLTPARDGLGPWSQVLCQGGASACVPRDTPGVIDASGAGFGGGEFNEVQGADWFEEHAPSSTYSLAGRTAALQGTEKWEAQLKVLATQYNVPYEELRAVMMVESAGNPGAVSPAGAHGLMQLTLDTARTIDPTLRSKSDAQVAAALKDPAYNMQLGTIYYAQQRNKFGDPVRATAAYNGGPGANAPSSDCPGLVKWQCKWDSPGCYNTSSTNCTPNTGYAETRTYVSNVAQFAEYLKDPVTAEAGSQFCKSC